MDKKQLFSATRLRCQCYLEDSIGRSQDLLDKCERLVDRGKYKQTLNTLQEHFRALKELQKKHIEWRGDYARDLVDLVKVRTLNVGPRQTKLQTVPYLTGREKRERDEKNDDKSSGKKKKRGRRATKGS